MASKFFGMPIAAVSLTDADRQWFKSRVGVDHWEIPRFRACCGEVADTSEVLVVTDLLESDSYRDSALAESAIDDFGTGYSSLAYLQDIPAQIVNIDRSFIKGLDDMPRSRILVESMLSMAHNLGYRVVAEGVETQQTYDYLESLGCHEAQGFLMARPLDVADFEAWLAASGAWHSDAPCAPQQ